MEAATAMIAFLGAPPGFDAVELGLQVAIFLFYRRPGALHQRGFEPGSTLAPRPSRARAVFVG